MLSIKNGQSESQLKIACILDEFSYECLKYEAQLIPVTPTNWQDRLNKERPHFLFVESAWKGSNGAWQYKIGKYSNQTREELQQMITWCKARKIPTVFWNKEDPFHFHKFIDAAKLFDYIFTTDENSIKEYKKVMCHDRIYPLPFAAQPKIHNPIRNAPERLERLCFAGSYYANRHEERKKDLENLLDAAQHYGLDIFDRNYPANQEIRMDFRYPERFEPYIRGNLPYDEVVSAYKRYKIMLNVNSIKNSPTMFSRRVFEILACGTPVVSNYSCGIENLLGKNIVLMGHSKEDYQEAIEKLMTDSHLYDEMSIRGIREIYKHHTYRARLTQIVRQIGYVLSEDDPPKVSVLSIVANQRQFQWVCENYLRQSYTRCELIILSLADKTIGKFKRNEPGYSLCCLATEYVEDLNQAIHRYCDGDYIGWFHWCHYYGINYLLDLINAGQYTESKILGKVSYFVLDPLTHQLNAANPKHELSFVSRIKLTHCILNKKLFAQLNLEKVQPYIQAIEIYMPNPQPTCTIFSADKYNFIEGFRFHCIEPPTQKKLEAMINI
ncbi:MAG: glycosyltransferase [Chitinophagales bacterium]